MQILIRNNQNYNYIILDFDFENKYYCLIDKKLKNEFLLNILFINKSYSDIINWIKERCGNKSLNECLELIKANNLKSNKDNITLQILNDKKIYMEDTYIKIF